MLLLKNDTDHFLSTHANGYYDKIKRQKEIEHQLKSHSTLSTNDVSILKIQAELEFRKMYFDNILTQATQTQYAKVMTGKNLEEGINQAREKIKYHLFCSLSHLSGH